MKLVTWNVNGLRAVQKRDFGKWFEGEKGDVVCLQEVKCHRDQIKDDETILNPMKYASHWACAEKAGYSGLVTYSRKEPLDVRVGIGVLDFDREGRWLETDFQLKDFKKGASGEITVINSYFPNSQRDHARLPYKLAFLAAAALRLEDLRKQGKQVYLCGDFNIAHKEIDLKNPKTNMDNAGFLPEERAWMDKMVGALGWVDTFREFEKGPGHYTWWSYRPGVREKNVGWRLDYFLTNPETRDRLKSAHHMPDVMGSDHCPVRITLKT